MMGATKAVVGREVSGGYYDELAGVTLECLRMCDGREGDAVLVKLGMGEILF